MIDQPKQPYSPSRRAQKRLIHLAVGVVILLLLATIRYSQPLKNHATQEVGTYAVAQFDDGDTLIVDMNGVEEKVRFIGVDTPETKHPRQPIQCFGHEASAFTKNTIGDQPVRLVADPLNTNRDRYDRLLRYVYLPDGTLLNAELIRQGYGFAYTGFPFEKKQEFAELEKQARVKGIGVWQHCSPTLNQYGTFTSNDELPPNP